MAPWPRSSGFTLRDRDSIWRLMDTPEVDRSTAAVVALKAAEHAKSRLDFPAPLRRRLAWTMAVDTLAALSAAVSQVLVVSNQPALASRLGPLRTRRRRFGPNPRGAG